MKQVYLDLVDGHHIKVTPLGWDDSGLNNTESNAAEWSVI